MNKPTESHDLPRKELLLQFFDLLGFENFKPLGLLLIFFPLFVIVVIHQLPDSATTNLLKTITWHAIYLFMLLIAYYVIRIHAHIPTIGIDGIVTTLVKLIIVGAWVASLAVTVYYALFVDVQLYNDALLIIVGFSLLIADIALSAVFGGYKEGWVIIGIYLFLYFLSGLGYLVFG